MPVRRWGARLAALWALSCLLCSTDIARAYTVKETESGSIVRWHRPTVTLRIDESIDRFFDGIPVRNIVTDAARAWRDLANVPEILVNEGNPGPQGFDASGSATNGIYLIEDWVLAESSLAVTVATYESRSGKMVDTDILVNANHPFGEMPVGPEQVRDAYDLPGVMAHEMGHVLGLGESYEERMATMWPSISRGETHQRDIDDDDAAGAEEAYSGATLSETSAGAGCSGASVVVKRGATPWGAAFLCIALLTLLLWLHSATPLVRRFAPIFGAGVLLFGAPYRPAGDGPEPNERVEIARTLALRHLGAQERAAGLRKSAESPSARVRMTAAAVLERSGNREDRAVAARLARDSDAEVRRVGRGALRRLLSAPPLARISKLHPDAEARLSRLLGRARRVERGALKHVDTEMRAGLIWSRYRLTTDQGDAAEIDIPGGTFGDFTQVVSEEDPPAEGDTVVVSFRERGAPAWAHLRDGVVYGGSLGEGPGIEWEP